jgi:hypothetical protein
MTVAGLTWGVPGRTGRWRIDLEAPASLAALDARVRELVPAVAAALAGLARVQSARANLMAHDEDQIVAVREWVAVSVAGPAIVPAAERLAPGPVALTDVVLDLDVAVRPPGGAPDEWVAGAGSCTIFGDIEADGDHARIHGLSVAVQLAVDVWLDVTLDPASGAARDNRAWARVNRPRLEAALRACERTLGAPIVEAASGLYSGAIERYGFRGHDAADG